MYTHSNDSGCINDAGYKCKFPFEYDDQQYFDCTKAGRLWSDKTWCYDVRGNKHYDDCSNCSMGSQKLIANKNEL